MPLTEEQIGPLVRRLKESRIFNEQDLEHFWADAGIHITNDDWLHVLSDMVDLDVFRWLPFVCAKLRTIASTSPDFIELITKLAEMTKRDMTAGLVLQALESIGMDNPGVGVELHRKTYESGNLGMVELSGFFLSGLVRDDLKAALALIKPKFAVANPSQRVALVRALASRNPGLGSEQERVEIFELLRNAGQDSGRVLGATLDAYFKLFKQDPVECGQRLAEFSRSKDISVQNALARNLWLYGLGDSEVEWELIGNLAISEDPGILSMLVHPILKLALQRPTSVLELFRDWFERGMYLQIHDVDLLLSELGDAKPAEILKTAESWVGKSTRVDHHIPRMLSTVFARKPAPLIASLEFWIHKDGVFRELGLKTFLETLSEEKLDSSLIERCYEIISKTAEASGVDVAKTLRGEKDNLWQCRLLLEELLGPKITVDYATILRNLGDYPAIRDFIGIKWFGEMRRDGNNTHDLLVMLARAKPDLAKIEETLDLIAKESDKLKRAFLTERIRLLLGPPARLAHLNAMLAQIKMDEKGNGELRDGLKNEEQLWQTVSEIEIAGSLRSKGIVVELKPNVGGGELDVKAKVDSSEVLVEVINPEMWRTLRLVSGGASIPNRVAGKFVYEFEQHLKESQELKVPVLVALDTSRSEIDEESVENYLKGSLQYTFLKNENSGETHDGYWSRANDSMAKKNLGLNVISGAIVFKTPLGDDCKIRLQGRIILNEDAVNKLPENVKEKLEAAFFG